MGVGYLFVLGGVGHAGEHRDPDPQVQQQDAHLTVAVLQGHGEAPLEPAILP